MSAQELKDDLKSLPLKGADAIAALKAQLALKAWVKRDGINAALHLLLLLGLQWGQEQMLLWKVLKSLWLKAI